ncbi:MAG: S8 family serine peptidase [Chloroflexales bacterium]|nr:S8 family serine peptidase [Chloroflexales bacterium]
MSTHHLNDAPYPPPMHEGFVLQLPGRSQLRAARQIVRERLGPGWRVTLYGDTPGSFEVRRRRSPLDAGQAWQATYELRSGPEVLYAEPVFAVSLMNRDDWGGPGGQRERATGQAEAAVGSLCFESTPLAASADPEWSLNAASVPQAWQRFFPPDGPPPGTGIIIGHPDTGYRLHPEIRDNLQVALGYDFVSDDPNALDELAEGPLLFPGHGTGTASVIVSPRHSPNAGEQRYVSGVAPGAQVMPLRVTRSVVLLMSTFALAHAIEYAADRGAHVISISLGGIFNGRLHDAIGYAQRRGVIVLAAAGNCVRFVTWPAAYSEVIAVAASNALNQTWRGSSRGGAVDVTAPGESVWCAHVTPPGAPAARSSGTSFAVATTAGLAALWLAHHGRDGLVQRFGAARLPLVFQQILCDTCVAIDDPSWTPGDFGTGLVDAEALLAAPLPRVGESASVAPLAAQQSSAALDGGGSETFAHLFEQHLAAVAAREGALPGASLTATLAAVLRSPQANLWLRLREVGQELAFQLATDPHLYHQFERALARAPGAGPSDATAEAAAPGAVEDVRLGLLSKGLSPTLKAQIGEGGGA